MKLTSYISLAAGVLACLLLGGCERVFDDGEDCPATYRLHFVYDYNMLRTDAAPTQVGEVELRIFSGDGSFLRSIVAPQAELHAAGMTMDLDLAPGTYSYVALGYSGNLRSCYDVAEASMLAAQTVRLRGEGTPIGVKEILPLYHGHGTLTLPDDGAAHTYTCSLVKDFNDVKVVLQNLSGEAISPDDFTFTVSDDNSVLGPDNVPVEGNPVVYEPVLKASGSSQVVTSSVATKAAAGNLVLAEFTLGRLYLDKAQGTVLRVTGSDGHVILSLPLAESFLLVKGYYNSSMGDQEFLDRMDDFSLTLFLQGGNWLSASLVVNSWKVVINNSDFGN